jgi:hypothetical protein
MQTRNTVQERAPDQNSKAKLNLDSSNDICPAAGEIWVPGQWA